MKFSVAKMKEARELAGYSQSACAEALLGKGTKASTYGHKERGLNTVTADDIAVLATLFDVNPSEFFEMDDAGLQEARLVPDDYRFKDLTNRINRIEDEIINLRRGQSDIKVKIATLPDNAEMFMRKFCKNFEMSESGKETVEILAAPKGEKQ